MRTNIAITRNTKLAQAIALTLTVLAANQAQATDYSFTDLRFQPGSYSPVHDINNLGPAVGQIYDPIGGGNEATYWDGVQWHTLGGWQSLPWTSTHVLGGTPPSNAAYGINDNGQIAGYTGLKGVDADFPTVWNNGVAAQLDNLPGISGDTLQLAYSINNNGKVASWGFNAAGGFDAAFSNSGETAVHVLSTLGGSWTFIYGSKVINDAGQIVGGSNTIGDGAIHAVAWQNEVIHDLGTLGGTNSFAYGTNQGGQIIGYSNDASDTDTRAVLWTDANAAPVDLGTLGGANAFATGINDLGQIVGWSETAAGQAHLTLWDHGQIVDLTSYLAADLLASGLGVDTSTYGGSNDLAARINNAGVILGNYADTVNYSQTYSFLLTPTAVPVPGAVWLFGSALAGFVGMKRRKQGQAA